MPLIIKKLTVSEKHKAGNYDTPNPGIREEPRLTF